MKKHRLNVSVFSTKGNSRSVNQDSFSLNGNAPDLPHDKDIFISSEYKCGFFAVADGMGGEKDGELASNEAVSSLAGFKGRIPSYNEICSVIETANDKIFRHSEEINARVGSTIVIAIISGGSLSVYNVGDSKCYLCSAGIIRQLSKDHTVTAQMVEAGMLTPEQAMKDKRRHELFQHLGMPSDEMALSVYRNEAIPLSDGDTVILCSDGLTDGLTMDEMLSIVNSDVERVSLSRELVRRAMQTGSSDNITAVTISVSEKKGFRIFR